MSLVRVENVQVTKPVAKFNDELEFVISFECLAPGLEEELEWKVIYVGSPDDVRFDQVCGAARRALALRCGATHAHGSLVTGA
jgi:hypothetical protein